MMMTIIIMFMITDPFGDMRAHNVARRALMKFGAHFQHQAL